MVHTIFDSFVVENYSAITHVNETNQTHTLLLDDNKERDSKFDSGCCQLSKHLLLQKKEKGGTSPISP
jgi:hypothetical protein